MSGVKQILVVEDDHDIREVITEYLNESGFDTRAAENGAKAIQLLRSGYRPDLILLDLMMPVMDGFAFRAEQLNEPAFAEIPIIVMSADGNITQKQSRIAAADYLKKPLDIYDLISVLNKQLGI